MLMQNSPFISVLMPVRNEAGFIGRSIRAVLAQDYPHDRMEVIVADGLSEDGTREVIEAVRERHPDVKLIDNPAKIVSTGLNAALRLAKGEVIIRVDGHCEIASDYIDCCVSHLANDKVDCVGGPVETIGETYAARVIAAVMSSSFGVGGSAFRVMKNSARLTDTVPFPAYRRETIQRAGLFDEELVRNQDDEYNYRVRKLGGRILLSPDIRSRYYSRASFLKLWKQYFQYGYWKVRVLQKHPWQMRLRQFVPPLFVAALLAALLLLPIFQMARYFTALVVSAYAVASITASIFVARKSGWKLLPLLPLVFATLHLAYGSGFLIGLVRFWNRWGQGQDRSQFQELGPGGNKYERV
jgi:succinoglycan biosynthesis protein ExoA